jgi:DNA primase
VMIMPEGLDPAEFVTKHGAPAVREAAAGALPLVEYMVRRTVERHELATVEDRSRAVAEALPLLERLTDPVRRSEYAGLLADLTDVSETSVLQALERRLGSRPEEVAKAVKRTTAAERVEREMLRLLVQDADTYRGTVGMLTEEHFKAAAHRRVFVALRDGDGDVGALTGGADEKLAGAVAALIVEPLEGDLTPEYSTAVWARLQEFLLKSRSEALRRRLQKLNPVNEPGSEELFEELVSVDGELRRLREGVHGAA